MKARKGKKREARVGSGPFPRTAKQEAARMARREKASIDPDKYVKKYETEGDGKLVMDQPAPAHSEIVGMVNAFLAAGDVVMNVQLEGSKITSIELLRVTRDVTRQLRYDEDV